MKKMLVAVAFVAMMLSVGVSSLTTVSHSTASGSVSAPAMTMQLDGRDPYGGFWSLNLKNGDTSNFRWVGKSHKSATRYFYCGVLFVLGEQIESYYQFRIRSGDERRIRTTFSIYISRLLKPSFIKILVISFIMIIAIEVFQFVACIGIADIDDVFLNLVGCSFGYIIYSTFADWNSQAWLDVIGQTYNPLLQLTLDESLHFFYCSFWAYPPVVRSIAEVQLPSPDYWFHHIVHKISHSTKDSR